MTSVTFSMTVDIFSGETEERTKISEARSTEDQEIEEVNWSAVRSHWNAAHLLLL